MTFIPLLMEGKTMSNLTTFLDRLDKKTAEICELNALIKQREDKHSAFQSVVFNAFSGPPKKGESSEDYVRRIAADKANLELRRRELVGIVTAIDELPLPKADDESYEQYVLRLGDYLRAITSALKSLGPCDGETVADSIYRVRQERNDAERKVGDLSLSHSLAMEKAAAEIEKLGKRESELNALHDTIEALPGFPMQPEETYAEYLQRLAADRAHHADERSRLFTELEHLKASSARRDKLQGTQDEIREWILQVEQARKERDKAREEATTATAEREHFRAKWDASLKARDSAQDEARRARETNEALQGQLTLRSQVIARLMMDPATDKLFNERDWSDAARKVLIDARALCGDTSEANVTTKEPQ